MAAGLFAVGHRQRFEHVNVLLKGSVRVFSDDGSSTVMAAPLMFVGKPGRKVGIVLEDVVWQNIYATTETDVAKLEAMLLDKTPAWEDDQAIRAAQRRASRDADRADFARVLEESGFSRETVRQQSENELDQIPMPLGSWNVKTGTSDIEGTGVFVCSPVKAGEVLGPARLAGKRTPLGRFTNHSPRPNARMELSECGDVFLVASQDIDGCAGGQDGEEVTIDYRQALALSGVRCIAKGKS